jgi:hypothetical protein
MLKLMQPDYSNPYTNNQPFVQMLYVRVEDAKDVLP